MSELKPTLHDLYAAIGQTLVQWGFLEGAMTEAGIDWRRPATGAVVAEFLAELAEPRRIRNALAHGITSARADPWSADDPVVVCKLDDGSLRKVTLSELKATQVRIERLRLRLPLI